MECPRCGARKCWTLAGGRRRCARCRFDWKPGRLPLRLSRADWRSLLTWFVRGVPSAEIARETGLERKRVLRALTVVREAMQRSNPAEDHENDIERGTSRTRTAHRARHQTAVALYARHGLAGASVIAEEDMSSVMKWLRDRTAVPEPLHHYGAIVFRGRLHRVPPQGSGHVPFGQVESFWAYVQRHLRTRGGIRPDRLRLYLAEYTWRYNHRKLPSSEQAQELLRLLGEYGRWMERDFPSPRKLSPSAGYSAVH